MGMGCSHAERAPAPIQGPGPSLVTGQVLRREVRGEGQAGTQGRGWAARPAGPLPGLLALCSQAGVAGGPGDHVQHSEPPGETHALPSGLEGRSMGACFGESPDSGGSGPGLWGASLRMEH